MWTVWFGDIFWLHELEELSPDIIHKINKTNNFLQKLSKYTAHRATYQLVVPKGSR